MAKKREASPIGASQDSWLRESDHPQAVGLRALGLSGNGWIMADGTAVPCGAFGHLQVVTEYLEKDGRYIDGALYPHDDFPVKTMRWIKIQTLAFTVEINGPDRISKRQAEALLYFCETNPDYKAVRLKAARKLVGFAF